MAKKNVKSFKKVEKKTVEAVMPTVNELVIEAANRAVEDHGFDGVVIVGLRDGNYVPYALAKSIPDLLTLKYVLEKEVDRLITLTFNKPQE